MNLKQIMSMDPVPPPDKPIPIHLANQALYLNRGESSSVFNKATSSINFLNQLYQFLPPNVVKHLQGLDNEATPTKKVGDEFVIDEQKKQEMKRNLDTPDAIYATDYERAWWDSNDRAWTHEPDQYRIDRSSTYYGGAHSFANQFNKSLIINFSRKPHLVEGAQSFFFNNISASSGVRGAETWSAFKRDGEAPSAHRSQSTFQFLNSSYWTNLNAVLGRPDEELTFNNVAPTASDSWGLIGTKLKNRHEGFQQATADGGNTHKLSKSITETKKNGETTESVTKVVDDTANIFSEQAEKYGDIVRPTDPKPGDSGYKKDETDNAVEQLKYINTKLKVRSDGLEREKNRDLLTYLSETDGEYYENASIYELIMSGAHIAWLKGDPNEPTLSGVASGNSDKFTGTRLNKRAFNETTAKQFYYASAAVNESLNRYQLGFNNMLGPASKAPDDRKGWYNEETGLQQAYWGELMEEQAIDSSGQAVVDSTGKPVMIYKREISADYYAHQQRYLETYWEKYKANVLDQLDPLNRAVMGAIPYLNHIMDSTPQRLFHSLNPYSFQRSDADVEDDTSRYRTDYLGQYPYTHLDTHEYYDFAYKSTIMSAYYLANYGDDIKGSGINGQSFNQAVNTVLGGMDSIRATVGSTTQAYDAKESYNQSVLNEYFGHDYGVDSGVTDINFLNPERARYLYQLAMLIYQESLESGSVTDQKLAEYRFEKDVSKTDGSLTDQSVTFWKSEIKDYLTHFGLALTDSPSPQRLSSAEYDDNADMKWIVDSNTHAEKQHRWTSTVQERVEAYLATKGNLSKPTKPTQPMGVNGVPLTAQPNQPTTPMPMPPTIPNGMNGQLLTGRPKAPSTLMPETIPSRDQFGTQDEFDLAIATYNGLVKRWLDYKVDLSRWGAYESEKAFYDVHKKRWDDYQSDLTSWNDYQAALTTYNTNLSLYNKEITNQIELLTRSDFEAMASNDTLGLSQFTFMQADVPLAPVMSESNALGESFRVESSVQSAAKVIIAALSPMIQYTMGATHKFETVFSDEYAGWRDEHAPIQFYVDTYPFRQATHDRTYDNNIGQKSTTWAVSRYKVPVSQFDGRYHVNNEAVMALSKAPDPQKSFYRQSTDISKALGKLRSVKGGSFYNRNRQALTMRNDYYQDKQSAFWNFMVDSNIAYQDRVDYMSMIHRRNRLNQEIYARHTLPLWEQGVDQRLRQREEKERWEKEAVEKNSR